MLKRISTQQLRLGMYIEEFCGTWMEHPFWRSGFVLRNAKDLERILATSVRDVWIDVSKGTDVPRGEPAVTRAEVQFQVDSELGQLADLDKRKNEPVALAREIGKAAKICAQSKQAVTAMFQEARMGHAIDTAQVQKLVAEISDSVTRNASAMISLARLKTADDYTYMHSVAVCALMVVLARQLGLSEAQVHSAGMAGLLHDLGKVKMPMSVLNKPGKLTEAEYVIVKNHPALGYEMLQGVAGMDPVVLDVCLHHHEKTDGSGYPEGLHTGEISLFAKMGAVCDVYDAITSNRPYKSGWDPAESLRKMAEWSKGHFDLPVFHAFVKSVGIYPTGSLVMLASGLLAIVVEQSKKSLMLPRVRVFYSTKSNQRIAPELIDLSSAGCSDKILHREDPAKWQFPDLNDLWMGSASSAL
ncbi:phosphodiesterase [Rhodoferax koreense]|uniref:Phosphodiesterase n=1 Tax=Rhodoferax koreensis TaxID=1842727 RepID=A0A1P8K0V3_9BURK|nr:HD-GYP domain-containing protein [Rhodoferax koreense]APW39627.1 phosphodiesterase [Rhodoferax koreense]